MAASGSWTQPFVVNVSPYFPSACLHTTRYRARFCKHIWRLSKVGLSSSQRLKVCAIGFIWPHKVLEKRMLGRAWAWRFPVGRRVVWRM